MELYLIRHWKTKGNLEKRYIGTTDEPILSGRRTGSVVKQATSRILPDVSCVAVSPMKRCRETAELLFPGKKQEVCDAFRECDFGQFENRNYEELKNRPEYQRWLDSGGTDAFPGGESREIFAGRCVEGFVQKVTELRERKIETGGICCPWRNDHGDLRMAGSGTTSVLSLAGRERSRLLCENRT